LSLEFLRGKPGNCQRYNFEKHDRGCVYIQWNKAPCKQRTKLTRIKTHYTPTAAATIPPPGTVWGICTLTCPHGRALQLCVHPRTGHLSISGYYPRAFVAHREKTAATSFLCCMPKWMTIKYVKQILYYIIVECWFSSVNQCLRFSFSPYYIYCIYNEKLSAIKASV
jgi:hypothetical protein